MSIPKQADGLDDMAGKQHLPAYKKTYFSYSLLNKLQTKREIKLTDKGVPS